MKKDLSTPPKIDKEALDGDGDDEKFSGSWPPKVEFCHRLTHVISVGITQFKVVVYIENVLHLYCFRA